MTSALVLTLLAFAAPDNFLVPAELGGGNGVRFTGSPVSHWDCSVCHEAATQHVASRVDCSVCHKNPPKQALSVTATPDLFSSGYTPGASYALELSLGATPPAAAFATEAVTRQGALAGQFAAEAALPPELLCDDGSNPVQAMVAGQAAQSVSCRKGLGTWRVVWTAPSSDVGPVTLYISAVAGNLDGSFTGDAASSRVLGIRSPSTPASGGCGGGTAAALLIAGVGLALTRRRGMLLLLFIAPVARAGDSAASLSANAGAGIERFSLSGPAFATPFWLQLTFPRAELSVRLHPTRFVQGSPLGAAFFEASYARGWAPLPPLYGGAFANPTDARLALGYEFSFGSFTLAPRALYRVRMGGIETNPLFDDVVYQGLGAALGAAQEIGPVSLSVLLLALAEFDAGTLATAGYGRFGIGATAGARAGVQYELFSSGWALALEYEVAVTAASFGGDGNRLLGPVRRDDFTQAVALRVVYRS